MEAGKVRIRDLAKELNMSSTDMVALLGRLGLEAKNELSVVDPKVADLPRVQLGKAAAARVQAAKSAPDPSAVPATAAQPMPAQTAAPVPSAAAPTPTAFLTIDRVMLTGAVALGAIGIAYGAYQYSASISHEKAIAAEKIRQQNEERQRQQAWSAHLKREAFDRANPDVVAAREAALHAQEHKREVALLKRKQQSAASERADPPMPEEDRHAEREAAQQYWRTLILAAAMADTARVLARDAISQDDFVAASGYVKEAIKYSASGEQLAHQNVPPGWDDVESTAADSMATLSAAYTKMRSALDTRAPSEMSDTLDLSDEARAKMADAVHLARVHYIDMGGKASDVSDGTEEAKGMTSLLEAAAEAQQ